MKGKNNILKCYFKFCCKTTQSSLKLSILFSILQKILWYLFIIIRASERMWQTSVQKHGEVHKTNIYIRNSTNLFIQKEKLVTKQ